MDQSARNQGMEHSSFCCCGHAEHGPQPQGLSRREFISVTGAATAVGLSLPVLVTGALAQSDRPERRPLAPFADLGTVGVHPVHEAEASETLPAFQEGRMKRILFPRLLETGHDDVEAATPPAGELVAA